jgi:TPR repeat protein
MSHLDYTRIAFKGLLRALAMLAYLPRCAARPVHYLTKPVVAQAVAASPEAWSVAAASFAAIAALTFAVGTHAATIEEVLAADRPGNEQATLAGYRRAADNGDAAAQYALGRMYLEGRGVKSSSAEAFIWFSKAALRNNPGAEFELSVMFASGSGTTRDPAQARLWLTRSAAAGYEPAELQLSGYYERGEVVAKDLDEALSWATKAAEQGDQDAQLKAGLLYGQVALRPRRGVAVTSDQFRAIMDSVLGPAKWRETSGYRTRAREDELRNEGAGTVPPGVLSRHSIGTPGAPGAYDVVVQQLSMKEAAARLWNSGVKFKRVIVESAHGPEGPHLHIEPLSAGEKAQPLAPAAQSATSREQGSEQEIAYALARNWLEMAAARGNITARAVLTRISNREPQIVLGSH